MERKIGEIFTYNGKIYQVVKSDTCTNCAFRENDCSIIRSRIGLCVSSIRFDKTNVVFKEIKMEIKNNQLTIDIPEGMEIDLENSDLAKGIVRFKQSTITYEDIETNIPIDNFLLSRLYHAREDEKKELFDALAKGGKAWDAEKKIIVNLKHKCEFKPFDKILGRNEKDDVWEADLFSHYREESQYPFRCIGFSRKYCIPYNKETAHLLGTTDDWEGGEQ